jgi:hypothetical protein
VVAQALRFRQFLWFSPKPNPHHSNQSVIGANGDVMFDKALAGNSPTMSQFTLLVNGVSRAFSGQIFAGGITLSFGFVAPNPVIGDRFVLQYNPNGAVKLQDSAGNLVGAFSTPVRNVLG